MPALAPLLPIKMSIAQVSPSVRPSPPVSTQSHPRPSPPQLSSHCIIDIAPIMLAMFLDGRTGMSYGFLAFQLPTGPVEDCSEVRVLCTRSGCDKQNPHPNNDWTVLSFGAWRERAAGAGLGRAGGRSVGLHAHTYTHAHASSSAVPWLIDTIHDPTKSHACSDPSKQPPLPATSPCPNPPHSMHPPPTRPPKNPNPDRETFGLEMAAELKGVCSPSFDSWLIVSQAVANVTLAAKFKQAGRCRRFVDQARSPLLFLVCFWGLVCVCVCVVF